MAAPMTVYVTLTSTGECYLQHSDGVATCLSVNDVQIQEGVLLLTHGSGEQVCFAPGMWAGFTRQYP